MSAIAPEILERNRALLQQAFATRHRQDYEPAVARLPGAVLVPPTRSRRLDAATLQAEFGIQLRTLRSFDGGAYLPDGSLVAASLHRNGTNRVHLPLPDPGDLSAAARRPGRWLFAGYFFGHFGHFLTESLGRLWAVPRLREGLDGIAWLMPTSVAPARTAALAEQQLGRGFVTGILGRLGIDRPVEIVTEPTAFGELVVPAQLAINAPDARIGGHPLFRRFLRGIGDGLPAAEEAPFDLYVSRAGLEGGGGRFFREDLLEEAFRGAGWRVMRPEATPLAEQLATYRAARRLVFAEGSALHLYAAVARAGQHVGIVRRKLSSRAKFELQLAAFGVRRLASADRIAGLLVPPDTPADPYSRLLAWQHGEVVLDGPGLAVWLLEEGFLAQRHLPAFRRTLAPMRHPAESGLEVMDRAALLALLPDPDSEAA